MAVYHPPHATGAARSARNLGLHKRFLGLVLVGAAGCSGPSFCSHDTGPEAPVLIVPADDLDDASELRCACGEEATLGDAVCAVVPSGSCVGEEVIIDLATSPDPPALLIEATYSDSTFTLGEAEFSALETCVAEES